MKWKEMSIIVITLFIIVLGFILSNVIKNNTKIVLFTYESKIKNNDYVLDTYNGLKLLKKESNVKLVESLSYEKFEKKINTQISRGADFIWSVEGVSSKSVYKLASANPKINFCVLDAKYKKTLNNLCAVEFDSTEVAFLAGYMAGLTTKTNKVGFIGGKDEDKVNIIEQYYIKGVKYAGANNIVLSDYAGTYEDKLMGSNLAQAQYDQRVDIIFSSSGLTGIGVIEKSKTLGKWVIGIDTDQSFLAPDNVLASVTKDSKKVINNITKDYLNKKDVGDRNYRFGLEDGIMDIKMTKNVDVETKNKVNEMKTKIINGKINIEKDL